MSGRNSRLQAPNKILNALILAVIGLLIGAGALTGTASGWDYLSVDHARMSAYQVPDSLTTGGVFRGSRGRLALRISRVLRLGSDRGAVGSVVSATETRDRGILAIRERSSEIVLYDSTGRQIGTIGSWGRGRLNFSRPKIVRMFGDTVVVWDEGDGKFLFYPGARRSVKSLRGFAWPVLDFEVDAERLVAISKKTETTLMLYAYDLAEDSLSILDTWSVGTALEITRGKGHKSLLSVGPGSVLYALPGTLTLRRIREGQLSEFNLGDILNDYSIGSQLWEPAFLENLRIVGVSSLPGETLVLLKGGEHSVGRAGVWWVVLDSDMEFMDAGSLCDESVQVAPFTGAAASGKVLVRSDYCGGVRQDHDLMELTLEVIGL